MALLTLAEYKTITGTTSTTNDAFITSQIPVIQSALETYLDRKFDRAVNYEWLQYSESMQLEQWPVNNVLLIGTVITMATIADTSNTLSFSIVSGKNVQDGIAGMYVTNQYTLASTFYSFATYTTLATLKTAVETAHATVTITYATNPTYTYASVSTNLLRDSTGLEIYGAYSQLQLQYRIEEGTRRVLSVPKNITSLFQAMDYWFENSIFVAYNYGYDTANVPQGLKFIVSSIIIDIISIYDLNSSGVYKGIYSGETLGDYSWTLNPNSTLNALINDKYASALEPYRKKVI